MQKIRPKVIMVTNKYFPTIGGISTYIESLVTGLEKENFKTELICFPIKFDKWEAKISNKRARKLIHYIFTLFFISFAEWKIFKSRLTNRNLIVHSHSANYCLFIGLISRTFGCKTLHTYHSPIERSYKHLEYLSPKVGAIIFVSKETQMLYQSMSNIDNNIIEIIPGVIDQNKFHPRTNDEINKMKKKLIDLIGKKHLEDHIILFVGRVIEEKGIMPLIKSINIVKYDVPDVLLIIIGPHSYGEKEKKYFENLVSYIKKNKLNDNIVFSGPTSEDILMKSYAISTMLLVPSIWEEPSGIVPIEAMATGKPVIATRVGGLKYRIIDGKTGFLVEKNNPKELAEKIVKLLKNEKLLKKMGANARVHVEKNYNLEIMIKKHKKLYGTIIK
ncbi:MAG: glycosyltransferase family 4 protein [Thermoplasmata archaeon]|nr:MAG: glycosyltransferase family 4 protein [Thermoplasmata archaeon]